MIRFFLLLLCGTCALFFGSCYYHQLTPGADVMSDLPCQPRCKNRWQCERLDDALEKRKAFFLECITAQAENGNLTKAHQCHRAMRFLESARWWFRTVIADHNNGIKVYHMPIETKKRNFYCHLERLLDATSPKDVEGKYVNLMKAFP